LSEDADCAVLIIRKHSIVLSDGATASIGIS